MLHQYPIIDDSPATRVIEHPFGVAYGLVPRDLTVDPPEMFAPPSQIQLIPRSEWDARIDEQEEQQSSLEHLFFRDGSDKPAFVNLDQDGNGFCWAYSVAHSMMLAKLKTNAKVDRLNPHSMASIIKGGRDEGGWCGLSAKFAREAGCAEEGIGTGEWPLHSRNLKYDTPALRAAMMTNRIVEDWVDLTRDVYDQNLTFDMLATCLLSNQPCPVDFNHWSHSVCAIRLVRVERGSYGILILNSWKGWGRFGLGVLQGTKAVPDGALCTLTTTAA